MSLNAWYWFGGILGLLYGSVHLADPDWIAESWGRKQWSEDAKDFARLLGVWIIFQALVAIIIATNVHDANSRFKLTLAHVFKNLGAFLLRCGMWQSGRYPITSGFKASAVGDLIFVLGYGYYIVFPERTRTKAS